MIDQSITQEQRNYAETLVRDHNFGRRGVGDGTRHQQFIGMLGQTVIADLFGSPRPKATKSWDGGNDLPFEGLSVDVKTQERSVPPLVEHHVGNFSDLQVNIPSDILLFCSIHRKTGVLTVCGWICKQEFFEKARYYPLGTLRTRSNPDYSPRA
jgi:hypothetical protein